jgi:hypothetical protein
MDEQTTVELRFEYDRKSADEIAVVVDQVVAELGDDSSEAAEAARDAGLDPSVMSKAKVSVDEKEQGTDPLTLILVGIAVNAGSDAAKGLWHRVIWPRIQRQLGGDALGEEKEEGEE